jgi:aminoglycoside phosphotransferase (APT) family kinase protein
VLPVPGRVGLAERRAYVDARLQLLEGRVLSTAERTLWLAHFDALCTAIGEPDVAAVSIHADLSPMNIIVDDDGRIAVLDFTMAKVGTIYHDLSHLYFHLDLVGNRHRRHRGRISRLLQAMLDAYSPGLTAADPLFALMLLQQAVCHLAQLAERKVPVLDVAYRWYLRRRWQQCVAMLEPPAATARVA